MDAPGGAGGRRRGMRSLLLLALAVVIAFGIFSLFERGHNDQLAVTVPAPTSAAPLPQASDNANVVVDPYVATSATNTIATPNNESPDSLQQALGLNTAKPPAQNDSNKALLAALMQPAKQTVKPAAPSAASKASPASKDSPAKPAVKVAKVATPPPAKTVKSGPTSKTAATSSMAAKTDAASIPVVATTPPAPVARTALSPINTPQPGYPIEAARAEVSGVVVVSFTVNTDGKVSNIRVLSAKPHGVFERSVQTTLRSWRFESIDQAQTVTRTFSFTR